MKKSEELQTVGENAREYGSLKFRKNLFFTGSKSGRTNKGASFCRYNIRQERMITASQDRKRVRQEEIMSNEDLLLSQTGNSNFLARQSDSAAAVKKGENRSDVKEIKNVSEESERTGKKRESLIRKKNMDRLNKIHLRRISGNSDKSPAKTPKQETALTRCSISAIPSQEEVANVSKPKNAKKNLEEVVSTSKFKRKVKDVEKPSDSKSNPQVERAKRSASKTKAVTAFGTTFHKPESDQTSLPKKRPSSSMDRFRKTKRSKSKDAITEEAGDEPSNVSSQAQLKPSTKHSGLKMSLSKNKLTEMLEDKDKIKAAFETATGKRARSPYQASSKIETKKQSSKVRMEGDPRHVNGKQEEKSEIGKDLSFFEKIQQNVRAYFSPKSSEITKFEEEERKKVQEGEHPENDENIMIWKDGRIKRGFNEDSMRGDQNFLKCIQKEKKSDLDKGCKDITNEYFPGQKSARGNGSGPGGKIAYSYGDICKPSIGSRCRRLYYIKRRNCTEKPRTGSFHRSKTFQKNGLAPSAPKSSSSISLILEPDEQVENISSANGVASAFVQIQEFHQEIDPSLVQRRVNCARGTRNVNAQEGNLTPTANYVTGKRTAEWVKDCRRSGCRTCRSRLTGSRRKRTAAVAKPKSTTCLRGYDFTIENRTKSEGYIQFGSFIHPVVLPEDFPGRIPLPSEKVKPAPKQHEPFVPVHTQWFVYSVTDTKSIKTACRELASAESSARNTGQSGVTSERKKPETVPTKKPEVEEKFGRDESPSVTLKDIINLLRTIFHQSSEKVPENRSSRPRSGKDTGERFAMSHCLAKLMEEKKNYLNMEQTKNLPKTQKASFISDSFNFFNLLNKEFLSLKSSNPRIEELRNVIAQKKEPEVEEYLEMYKRVIRMSLTKPEQYLMDKAKKELEHYADMYYDLMKRICLEKEGESGTTFPSARSSEKHREKINCSEMVKSKVKKSAKPLDNCSEKAKTRIEKSHPVKMQENRANRDSDTGRCRATSNLKKTGGTASVHARNKNDSRTKPGTPELLGPQKYSESQLDSDGRKNPEEEKEDPSSGGKVFLALSLCDDGLLVKHDEDSTEDFPDGEDKGPSSQLSQHKPLEALLEASQIKKYQSGYVRVDSDTTVYPKSSIYENDRNENHVEQSVLKLKAFRKILRGELNNFGLFDEAEGENEQWQRMKGKLEDKSPQRNIKTLTKDGKRDPDRKHKFGADSMIFTTREERTKKRHYQNRSNSFSRSASPNEKEDTTNRVPWWRKDNFAPTSSGASKMRKSYQVRKTENYRSVKRTVPKTTRETDSREGKKQRKVETEEKIEEEPSKSATEFQTSPDSFSEWLFGLKDLHELLQDIPAKVPNLEGVSGTNLVCPEEEEERELMKLNLSGRDENVNDVLEKQEPPVCTGRKTSLRIGFNNPLKTEWMEESPLMDYQKVTEVLNQFLGSVAEVWKAAASLKDLIQPQASIVQDPPVPQTPEPVEDTGHQVENNHGTIESFKNFLRILTAIFEDDPREEVVRKQLCLLKKELIEHPHGPVHSEPQPEAGERTRFIREIAEIPREMKEMIASELTSDGGESENMEPAFILAAVKKIGEKLRESYFWDESESQNDRVKSECQPQKIYYRPAKKPSQEGKVGSAMKSNLGNLAEKIRKLCREKNAKDRLNEKCSLNNNASLDSRSSVYFDAADTVLRPGDLPRNIEIGDADNMDRIPLSPIDESYFSLNSSNFEKYRSLIYDKIITFLRSDDEKNVNYGVALLSRMIDRDGSSPVKIEVEVSGRKNERESKWQDLLDKLMETCQVIETEMKKEMEKCAGLKHEDYEKKMEVERTCEYLKGYVNRMKSLIKELKLPDGQNCSDDAVQRVRALENSRETNKERQLVSSGAKFPARQKYLLDNAMDFINSIGNIGYSFDKFPFFPKGFGLNEPEKKIASEMDAVRNEVSNELLLEGNKTMVKSLRKNIEKRQRKIQGMIEEAGNGATSTGSLLGEKIARKVRDLKKHYLLLEKMICDPTMLPPKWLKLDGSEGNSGNRGKPTKKGEPSVMTMLEDLMKQVSVERKTLKYSESAISADSRTKGFPSPPSAGSLTMVKIKYETLNVECPAQSRDSGTTKDVEDEIENGVPLRPVTA